MSGLTKRLIIYPGVAIGTALWIYNDWIQSRKEHAIGKKNECVYGFGYPEQRRYHSIYETKTSIVVRPC